MAGEKYWPKQSLCLVGDRCKYIALFCWLVVSVMWSHMGNYCFPHCSKHMSQKIFTTEEILYVKSVNTGARTSTLCQLWNPKTESLQMLWNLCMTKMYKCSKVKEFITFTHMLLPQLTIDKSPGLLCFILGITSASYNLALSPCIMLQTRIR
jgi:hypothetical protein